MTTALDQNRSSDATATLPLGLPRNSEWEFRRLSIFRSHSTPAAASYQRVVPSGEYRTFHDLLMVLSIPTFKRCRCVSTYTQPSVKTRLSRKVKPRRLGCDRSFRFGNVAHARTNPAYGAFYGGRSAQKISTLTHGYFTRRTGGWFGSHTSHGRVGWATHVARTLGSAVGGISGLGPTEPKSEGYTSGFCVIWERFQWDIADFPSVGRTAGLPGPVIRSFPSPDPVANVATDRHWCRHFLTSTSLARYIAC